MSDNHYIMMHDEKRCIGCQACTVACKVVNRIPDPFYRLQVQISTSQNDKGDQHFDFFRVSCQHCEDAPCIKVCPTGASYQDADGIVRVDNKKCIGCEYCIAACPYHVRYLNPQTHTADKCDYCSESRLSQGFDPACVTVCPTDALVFARADSAAAQEWLQSKKPYQYQVKGVGKPSLYRRKEVHQGGQ